ncbi:MAG: hypothetical protein CMJ62_10990 [Planctomycetaceae bacterium]|nr:hypothetical protein [Planctomycetaceae bacterium]
MNPTTRQADFFNSYNGIQITTIRCLFFFGVLLGDNLLSAREKINFTRDIQPIFSQKCLTCHGPDQQEAGLRLDVREGTLAELDSGAHAIVPGSVETSELVRRLTTNDVDQRMPPVDEGEPLSGQEIEAIRSWIAGGAPWRVHWAYRKLQRPEPPPTQDSQWCHNDIDWFVLANLERAGMSPSPGADRYTLIKRLYYDLLGLPPTLEAVDSFVHNPSKHAYEELVDDLLKSPRFGERQARHWLDKARYADSDGYEKDKPRLNAWRYRDWVIAAINRDLPFDQFSIKQLAGDLIPETTPLDQLATAFHRQTLTNTEGGTDQEEFRVKAIVDRVNTTGTVWLGLTIGCAQCHSHKYDPVSQQEYYELFAFFNNGDEATTNVLANQFPSQQQARELELELKPVIDQLEERRAQLANDLPRLEEQIVRQLDDRKAPSQTGYEIFSVQSQEKAEFQPLEDGSFLVSGANPAEDKYSLDGTSTVDTIAGVQIEVLADKSLPSGGPGRASHGNFVLSEIRVYAGAAQQLSTSDVVPLASASSDYSQSGWPVKAAIDGDKTTGWGVAPQLNNDHHITILFEQPVSAQNEGDQPFHLSVVLEQSYGKQHTIGRFRITLIDEAEFVPEDVGQIIGLASDQRTSDQQQRLIDFFASRDVVTSQLQNRVADLQIRIDEAMGQGKTMDVRVISQRGTPRKTHVLHRGDFLQPGNEVFPTTLSMLPSLKSKPTHATPSRLDLARWLFDESNPLTPRVAANHVWSHLFGYGLVRTMNDFGVRGEPPTHPDLLDWLAVEYRHLGWSRKALMKTILMSATYRQASWVAGTDPAAQTQDPENRLIHRQNRFRVEAEIVRDLYLAAGGLLSDKIGGPTVFPPLPRGIADLSYANNFRWKLSTGEDRYRRGMYTFFKRTSPHPNLLTFDCPDANTTNVSRQISNTPLAALTTLNNEVFFEAAQAMARRVLMSEFVDDASRMMYAMRLCVARPATRPELEELVSLLKLSKLWYAKHIDESRLMVGEYQPEGIPVEETAAWVATCRVVMNQDEFISRE